MISSDFSNSVPLNTLNDKPDKHNFLVVGIGASAGGIQALKEFFENVPADSGIAYVVILHLSPDHDSQLAQVLQAVTPIPVSQVLEKTKIEPNHAYVIPPNQHLTMEDEHILVSPNLYVEDRRAPVDIFFRTLAESHGSLAVCVVLSGTGANGSMGLKRIKERGGAAFVQNPREAEFNEMPRNSIATELVDEVLPVAAIPGKIIAYRNSLGTVHISVDADKRPEQQQLALREIFTQLRLRTGNDFSNYKRPTLLRRIERRINIRELPDLPAYSTFIQENPDEATALLKDLLISVTNFFRDKAAWNVIETEVLPNLLRHKTSEDALRIWVAGCATGEEAYSIAMLCAEKTMGVMDAPKVQIFATDLDEAAIAHAREGLYTLNDAADISPERLRRFFTKEGECYRVRREIREMILFAHHNFIKDPPFSHLDLITCRNVLIYLNNIAQERVSETFHFALEPGGYLFLGSSESFDGATDLYANFNREHHIFQTRQVQTRFYPIPESVPTFRTEPLNTQKPAADPEKKGKDRITYGDLHQRLLEEYAPPSIVINEDYDVVHISEKGGRFLQIAGGEPSQNVLKLVLPELRLELRSALFQSADQQIPVKTRPLQVTVADQVETINIHVRPVIEQGNPGDGFILVLFEPADTEEQQPDVVYTSTEPATLHLEDELTRLKSQLRKTIELYEFQSEELKASNEELQAMNEELRSAAEELETSKEELQSINEEMRTVNQELKVKIDETSLSSNNLQNLINSTDIGTIFLDRSLRVKMFTPATGRIFNLIAADYGRPLTDITNKIIYNGIDHDAEKVLENLQTVEREVRTYDNQVFLMRALPYRTSEDRINGVVITFVNITERKQAEEQALQLHRRTAEILESISDAFYTVDADFNFTYVNRKAEELWGRKHDSLIGKNFLKEFPESINSDSYALHLKAIQDKKAVHYEAVSPVLEHWLDISAYPDNMGGLSVYFRDIQERKQAEEALQQSEERLRLFVTTSSDVIYAMNADWSEMRNLKGNDFIPDTSNPDQIWVKKYIPEEDWSTVSAAIQTAIANKSIFELEHRVIQVDGFYGWTHSRAVPMLNAKGEIAEWFGAATDITANKQAEEALRESEERKTFLLMLSDAIRPLPDTLHIQATVTHTVMNHFRADRCYYCEVEGDISTIWKDAHQEDLPPAAGIYDLNTMPGFKAAMLTGRPLVVPDVHTSEAIDSVLKQLCLNLQIAAFIYLPIIKSEKLVGIFCLTQSRPRTWTSLETELAVETAERTWAAVQNAKIEEALRLSEERYRTVIESADMGAWDWNIAKNKVVWNKEHYTMLGADLNHQPMDAEYFMHFIHPDDKERVTNTLMEAVASNGTYQSDFRIVRDDNGETRWMNGFGRVADVKDGMAVRMVGVMSDITERKAMEQQKDDFLGIASHELKTPVTSIKAYTQILLDNFQKTADDKSARLMTRLDNQVDRLTSLIANLLDTTKIAEGQLPLHIETFSFNDLITERTEDLQRLSQTHQLVVKLCEDITITADRERIGQVITNLVSNAIKYSPQGKEITISCQSVDEMLTVSVQDWGIGIPEDVQQKVFDRFFRVKDSQLQTFPGMGLGLYITAGIIHRHGGTLNVNSKLGEGSTFSFTLPTTSNL